MQNVINNGTFLKYLTYYLKLGIYVNKGTSDDKLLERCIKMYNKYKEIETNEKITESEETYIRKCQKRLNLVLKIDENSNPVDIKKKENQLKMLYFKCHPYLSENNMADMIKYIASHDIYILSGIPLLFMLNQSKYQELIWQCTRALFYITQILISKNHPGTNQNYNSVIFKRRIFDDAAEKLETILIDMAQIEEKIKLDKIMAVDVFLNNKLIKGGITKKKVENASKEVKKIFNNKGIGADGSMGKMIDSITEKLTNIDLSNGNILQNMYSIARNVAGEMEGDLQGNPEKFQSTIGAITEVFRDAVDNSDGDGRVIPAELKNMFDTVLSLNAKENPSETDQEELNKKLGGILNATGIDADSFCQAINDEQCDTVKLENAISNINKTTDKYFCG